MIQNSMRNSSSFSSDDENERAQYSYNGFDDSKTRVVWITNYKNNEDFSITVPATNPLFQNDATFSNTIDLKKSLTNKHHENMLLNKELTPELSKLNLDDLLLLLYRLQQKTTRTPTIASSSTISSSSSSSGFTERKLASHSSTSIFNEIQSYPNKTFRRQHSFTPSNLADVPKQLTTTLAKPISSFHSSNTKHIHSPNDVVDKLIQSFNLQTTQNPRYTYQESQVHKAKLISSLLSSNSIQKSPYYLHHS